MKRLLFLLVFFTALKSASAQDIKSNPGSNHGNRFEQLGTILPSPNEYRTASGAPGPKYWQQRCDYDISCELDEPNRRLNGKEPSHTITTRRITWIIFGCSLMKMSTARRITRDIKRAIPCRKRSAMTTCGGWSPASLTASTGITFQK